MTIHFAAAEGHLRPRLSASQARSVIAAPANDNDGAGGADSAFQKEVLHAALRQFAKHGIGAADHAREQAERAFFAGDRETYRWWLGVCRTLDRRLAATVSRPADADSAFNLR